MKYLVKSHGFSCGTWGGPVRGEWSQWRLPSNSAVPLLAAGAFIWDIWQLSYRYKYTDGADATQGSCLQERDRTGSWGGRGRQTERDVKIPEQDALKVMQEHLWWTHQNSGSWSFAMRTREKKDFGSSTEGEVNKQSAMTESRSNEKA